MTKFLQGKATMNGLRGWSYNFANKSKIADGDHIEFCEMLISSY